MDVNNKLPSVLSYIGAAGVIVTGALAIHDTLNAKDDIENSEKWTAIAKHYIPSGISAVLTMGCIIASDILNQSQKAALLSSIGGAGVLAYDLLKDKADEESDLVWIFEDFRHESDEENAGWFRITLFDLFAAEYDINRMFALQGNVCLNDFYFYLNRSKEHPRTTLGDVYFWSKEFCDWIDFQHQKIVRDDGTFYYILTYPTPPRPDYANGC